MMNFWSRRKDARQAARWFALTLSGGFDLKADRSWQAWTRAGSDNLDAFEQVGASWEVAAMVDDRPGIQAMLSEVDDRVRKRAVARQAAGGRWFLRPVTLGAAGVVLALAAVFAWIRDPVTSTGSYATAIGEQRVVTLEDQSEISLNTATSVRVVYTRKTRKVELLNGEAVFKVTRNTARPFAVHALQGSSTAVGTQYAVQVAGTDSVSVSVLEGLVDVQPVRGRTGTATRLSAGSAMSYSGSGEVSSIRKADMDRIRGWQAQRLVFNDLSLGDALAEFNRYSSRPVVLDSSELSSRRISGVYRIGEEEAFLNALQQLYQLRVTRSDTQILLQPANQADRTAR
jgi:transmembrane sensor